MFSCADMEIINAIHQDNIKIMETKLSGKEELDSKH